MAFQSWDVGDLLVRDKTYTKVHVWKCLGLLSRLEKIVEVGIATRILHTILYNDAHVSL